ncbi:MAG: hypothetical protein AAGE99_03735 [Chlamydiota bacterium]
MLFLVTGCAILWIGGRFFYDLNRYFQLSKNVSAILDEWRVQEERGIFSIGVNYEFEWKGQTIQGVYNFKKPTYKNPHLADDHLKEFKEKSWVVWINPSRPTFASLQKVFPMRGAVKLALCLALFLYFIFLKGYVEKMNGSDRRFF